MIITYVLTLLLTLQPFPTVAMLKSFDDREACDKYIATLDVDDEVRANMRCMGIAHEGI